MHTDDQIPRELEHYVQQARKMRSEYIAALLRKGFNALSRAVRRAARGRTRPELSAKRILVER